MKTALVLGAGGFIGSHLVSRLKAEGYWVKGVDLKYPEFSKSDADQFIICDLRNKKTFFSLMYAPKQVCWSDKKNSFDEVYQLAADMGGAGYIFSGENDANVMYNSTTINLNTCLLATKFSVKKVFFSSSACIYPVHNQLKSNNPNCEESSAYPANPDSEYGWEKLFSERLYLAYNKNYKLNTRIARFHNIYGPLGSWKGGKEKAPAALCRKILTTENNKIEIWGDGTQTRSFLYIDECIEGIRRLMNSNLLEPVNIGSEEMVTINQLVDIICSIENKNIVKKYIPGLVGVKGRSSNNKLIQKELNWSPNYPLRNGIKNTYFWIKDQLNLG